MALTPEQIDALLPQTQCRRCGYDGCRPYADAVAAGDADINRCPPGGKVTVAALAELTGRAAKPIDPECGDVPERKVAFIREDECIGCTLCIQACPVDAIVGAAKLMHTVIAAECTGCALCLPACPVDCIDLPVAGPGEGQVHWPPETPDEEQRAARARRRYQARNRRLTQRREDKEKRQIARQAKLAQATKGDRKAEIAAAIVRAKAKRARRS